MLLPMIGFLFFLIVVGGLLSLVAIADPDHKRAVPTFLAFPVFFAGLFSLPLSFGLGFLGDAMGREYYLDGIGFLGGYLLGIIGGALLGIWLALRNERQLIQSRTGQEAGQE